MSEEYYYIERFILNKPQEPQHRPTQQILSELYPKMSKERTTHNNRIPFNLPAFSIENIWSKEYDSYDTERKQEGTPKRLPTFFSILLMGLPMKQLQIFWKPNFHGKIHGK